MARTRRGVTAIIGLLVASVCLSGGAAFADLTAQTATASDHVPLKSNWPMYAARGPIGFSVPQCSNNALARLVPSAARAAADAWNRATGRSLITVRLTGCRSESFQDRRNAVYAVNGLDGQRLGAHLSLMSGENGRLLEHDIQLSWARMAEHVDGAPDRGRSVVYNVVLHEMGHALGLGHVAALTGNCGLSVMREQMCQMGTRQTPTPADVRAVGQVYRLAPSNGRSSASEEDDTLTAYDGNGNDVIDDEEFFEVLDLWVRDELSTRTFNRLLEAWAQKAKLRAQAASAPLQSVRVFDLDGRPVLTQACSPQALAQVQSRLSQRATGPATFVVRTRDCRSGVASTRLIAIAPH